MRNPAPSISVHFCASAINAASSVVACAAGAIATVKSRSHVVLNLHSLSQNQDFEQFDLSPPRSW
jgi:hypothetical protein